MQHTHMHDNGGLRALPCFLVTLFMVAFREGQGAH